MNHHAFNRKPHNERPVGTRRRRPFRLLAGIGRTVDSASSAAFIRAMRGTATGVNVVTTDGSAGRFGLTVSAFSSVSAEPPTVLVCINRRSPACRAVRENRVFCVNVLSAGQHPVADTFSGNTAGGQSYDFNTGSWAVSRAGSPLLGNSVASFDCTLESAIDAGTHTIFIGAVRVVEHHNTGPLIYTNGSYRRACSEL